MIGIEGVARWAQHARRREMPCIFFDPKSKRHQEVNVSNHIEGVVEELSPFARFLGHSLGSALAFVCIALISLIPVGVVRVMIWLGLGELAGALHLLETMLLVADICLFVLVFGAGAVVFAIEVIVSARKRISIITKG